LHDLIFEKWLVATGDFVKAGDALMAVQEAGKSVIIQATSPGLVGELLPRLSPGDVISAGTNLVVIQHPPPVMPSFTIALPFVLFALGGLLLYVSIKFQLNREDKTSTEQATQGTYQSMPRQSQVASSTYPLYPIAESPTYQPGSFQVLVRPPLISSGASSSRTQPRIQPFTATTVSPAKDAPAQSEEVEKKKDKQPEASDSHKPGLPKLSKAAMLGA
jgi:pyruvate/2-oxoglutarate dehydrogenase complex dihydrolipoamide acyltransferase (E2) component